MSELSLGAGYDDVTADDWLDAVDTVLKGGDFTKRLITRTLSDVTVEPLYDQAHHAVAASLNGVPGAAPWTRGADASAHPGWDVRQRHIYTDAPVTNQDILDDLEQGATSVLLHSRHRLTSAQLSATLDGVLLDLVTIALDAGPWNPELAEHLNALWDQAGIAPDERRGALRIDPIGNLARLGAMVPESLDVVAAHRAHPHVTTMAADGTVFADGGASAALELAGATAVGIEYLRWLTSAGLSVDEAAAQIEFTWSATADQFETIAKLRAARRIWGRVVTASGGTDGGQLQHAITAPTMFTANDPWVNLLRSTTATFSAVAGGAQAITVLPFDTVLGVPSELGRRLARNASIVLDEESHVGQVIDPGGGSWFIEDYTEQLCQAAWAELQTIEGMGGAHAAVLSGAIQERVAEQAAARAEKISSRKLPIVGVSEFPDLEEELLERDALPPLGKFDSDPSVPVIEVARPARVFEEMRSAAPEEPSIFVAALGPPAVHAARLGFAQNFFAVGGLRVELDPDALDGYDDPGDVAAAFERSGLHCAVICSSDAEYEEQGVEVAASLKGAGCDRVWLAGNPGTSRATFQRAGVDAFIHLGADVVGELQEAHELIRLSGGRRVRTSHTRNRA